MERIKFTTMLLVLLTLGFYANAQTSSAGPKIVFEKLEHDYGTITEGDNGEVIFIFSNTGKEPLSLTKVHGCCGVVVLAWTKEAIAPNSMGFIKLRYHTSRIGGINKTITVNTNDPENQEIRLKLKGTIQKKQVKNTGETESAHP